MKRSIILFVCTILLSLNGLTKTIEWSITPEYDDLKPYSDNVYYCSNDGKWGLVNSSGAIILPPQYDFITAIVNGYAIAGVKDGSKNRICCIIDDSYNVENVSGSYYLVNKYYTYFSDSKLPVANKAGKQGFMNVTGELVIKCQFDNVHPFSDGYASVAKYPKAFYITDRYDVNPKQSVLPIEFNYGDITFASTFYNGRAVVAYNDKSAVINLAGKKVGNFKGKINATCYNKFDYTIKDCGSVAPGNDFIPTTNPLITAYFENGLYGYRQGSTVIAYPSFNNATDVSSNGYAVVTSNNKVGLIHIFDGDVTAFVTKSTENTPYEGSIKVNSKGAAETFGLVVVLPNESNASDYTVTIDNGDGSLQPAMVNITNNLLKANLLPRISYNAENVNIAANIYYKGIAVEKYSHTFAIARSSVQTATATTTYQAPSQHSALRIYGPVTQTERANEKDQQVVQAVIYNPNITSVSVTAAISIPSKGLSSQKKYTIPARSSQMISLTVSNVQKQETVSASVTLTTGQTESNKVTLKPYY
jgi:hypothetical protein